MSQPQARPPGSDPARMGPTRPATLVVAALAAAALIWLLVTAAYSYLPPLPWLPVVTLAGLAVIEGYLAYSTRARIAGRPGHDPVNPLLVARFVVLAKASALAGAIFAGGYAALSGWLFLKPTRAAAEDLPVAVAGLLAAAALMLAALWLERSCRVPQQPDDERGRDDRERPERAGGERAG